MMAEAGFPDELHSKSKAVATLLPYAVWQERDGQPEILDTLLRAVRASGRLDFVRWHTDRFAATMFSEATPRAIVLVSPHINWLTHEVGLVQRWIAAVPLVPYTPEVVQSIVDVLSQIACHRELLPLVAINISSWLTKRSCLPLVTLRRCLGANPIFFMVVRRLKDTDLLKSYLILLWSEWNPLRRGTFGQVRISIREDFGGTGMGHHRADLIQRLDHVFGQLDRGLEHLNQHNPDLNEDSVRCMRDQYGKLKDILLEMNVEATARTSFPTVMLLCRLTQAGHTQNLAQCLCVRFLSHVHNFESGTPQPRSPTSFVHEPQCLCIFLVVLIHQ